MKLAILFTHWFSPPFLSLWRFQTFSLKKSFPKHARDNKISSPKEQKHKKTSEQRQRVQSTELDLCDIL